MDIPLGNIKIYSSLLFSLFYFHYIWGKMKPVQQYIETVNFRRATNSDLAFLSEILVYAAAASGVGLCVNDLIAHPDSYQYVEGFPKGSDVGVVAETHEGCLVGAAWIRLLPTDAHAINEPLPELTMGVMPEYQRMGIGGQLLEELYKAASAKGITKISLGVHNDNLPAISLYKKQNWIEDGHFKEYKMMSRKTNSNCMPYRICVE